MSICIYRFDGDGMIDAVVQVLPENANYGELLARYCITHDDLRVRKHDVADFGVGGFGVIGNPINFELPPTIVVNNAVYKLKGDGYVVTCHAAWQCGTNCQCHGRQP